jgi:predicted TIM-barrel fold metal-dependent hydrolase
MWRAVKTWRAMRAEVPWVDRAPAEIIRDHVRFTLQPSDAPPDPRQMEQTIEQIGSDRLLLFSTDYPHWHFNGDAALPEGLSPSLIQRMLVDNPLETYPRLKETLQ